MPWTRGAEKQVDLIKRARSAREIRTLGDAQAVAAQLERLTVRMRRRAGTNGRLFGSVGPADIAAAVREAGGPEIDRRKIVVPDPIKAAGSYRVQVRLHPEVSAAVSSRSPRANPQIGLFHRTGKFFPQPTPQETFCCVLIAKPAVCPRARARLGWLGVVLFAPGQFRVQALTICQDSATLAASSSGRGSPFSPRASLASWSIASVIRQSRPPCSNTQAKDSGVRGRAQPVRRAPPGCFGMTVADATGPFRNGKHPGRRYPHRFSTGKSVRPVDFSVENLPENS